MTRTFAPGQIIFREGEESTDVFVILRGRVRIRVRTPLGSCVLNELGPGEIFGEMGVIEDAPRSATAEAIAETELEAISEAEFSQSILQQPVRLHQFLGTLFERLRHVSSLVRAQTATCPPEALPDDAAPVRFAARLQSRYEETGYPAERVDVEITRFPFLLGRAAAHAGTAFSFNHLDLPDRAPFQVSRHHCAIEQVGNRLMVRDRGSALGTLVNGQRIGVRFGVMQAPLRPGANELVLGHATGPHRLQLTVEAL